MNNLKPIETVYNGYKFRSRLEARWAVFFDALGVKYEYEPEGFELPSGKRYLPDFRVKCWGTRGSIEEKPFDLYIEVKGEMSEADYEKIREFALYGKSPYYCHKYNCNCLVEPSPSSDYDDHLSRWICPCGMAIGLNKDKAPRYHGCIYDNNINIPTVFNLIFEGEIIDNPVLIVGNIPNQGETAYWTDNVYCNYNLIDGDWFGAYPAASNGKFFLWGDDSNYIWNEEEVERAYDKARQARFEHGECG